MLYLVSTPIGHLEDITFRAIKVLASVDLILCEDTRHSQKLLRHYQIKKPLKSYHKFNEQKQIESLIQRLKKGETLALISDAGTPTLSDPGFLLVKACRENALPVVPIPGPCAAIAALTASGLDPSLFQFVGFLPRQEKALKKGLLEILHYPGTTIAYESPKRLEKTLQLINMLSPNRPLALARELTKTYETFLLGSASTLLEQWQNSAQKGEIVLLISGETSKLQDEWQSLSPEEHVHLLETTYHLSRRDAIKLAAEQRGLPKREVYNRLMNTTS